MDFLPNITYKRVRPEPNRIASRYGKNTRKIVLSGANMNKISADTIIAYVGTSFLTFGFFVGKSKQSLMYNPNSTVINMTKNKVTKKDGHKWTSLKKTPLILWIFTGLLINADVFITRRKSRKRIV